MGIMALILGDSVIMAGWPVMFTFVHPAEAYLQFIKKS
jgi:hypothetical protein